MVSAATAPRPAPPPARRAKRVAIIGGGWAGLAAAVRLTQLGHPVTLLEASRHWGGRARSQDLPTPQGIQHLDNGQHILIGAYRHTLTLLRTVGVRPEDTLLRLPLTLLTPEGHGLRLPRLAPSPQPTSTLLDTARVLRAVAWGVLSARGWTLAAKTTLLARAAHWAASGWRCPAQTTVAELSRGLPPHLIRALIDPLCVSALNTPAIHASGPVFLNVLRDALFGPPGSADLLIPRVPLSALWPQPAIAWLHRHGAHTQLGTRIHALTPTAQGRWCLHPHRDQPAPPLPEYDAIVWANTPSKLPRALDGKALNAPLFEDFPAPDAHTAIATVYAQVSPSPTGPVLPQPLLALPDPVLTEPASPAQPLPEPRPTPAQFVFDRGQLGGPAGLLALVISAAEGSSAQLQAHALDQTQRQLGLRLEPVRTVVERRATFACTPHTRRPPPNPLPGLWLASDEVHGPYPATLEGAMRSGWLAAEGIHRE